MADTLVASDNFNRASLGADWAQLNSFDGDLIIDSSIRLNGAGGGLSHANPVGRWVGAGTFTNDQWASIKLIALQDLAAAYWTGVLLRASADVDSARNLYYAIVEHGGAGPTYVTRVGKVINGAHTSLANTSNTWTNNDVLKGRIVGSSITVQRNGTDIAALSVTDTTLTTGKPGAMAASSCYADDWEGGNITAAGVVSLLLPSSRIRYQALLHH